MSALLDAPILARLARFFDGDDLETLAGLDPAQRQDAVLRRLAGRLEFVEPKQRDATIADMALSQSPDPERPTLERLLRATRALRGRSRSSLRRKLPDFVKAVRTGVTLPQVEDTEPAWTGVVDPAPEDTMIAELEGKPVGADDDGEDEPAPDPRKATMLEDFRKRFERLRRLLFERRERSRLLAYVSWRGECTCEVDVDGSTKKIWNTIHGARGEPARITHAAACPRRRVLAIFGA